MNLNQRFKWMQEFTQTQIDHFTGAAIPSIYFNPQGELAHVISNLKRLHYKYRPTPWLSNTHAHLVYFDKIRKKTVKLEYDFIEQLTMSDGGTTGIAWYGMHLSAETPTILVLHTITGSPASMRELVRDLYQVTGWRIALCLRRGHAGLPLSVPKINLFGNTQDLREQIEHIQQRLPYSKLYAVGSSAGTGLLVRYLGEEESSTPIQAAFALCPGYNTETGFSNVHPFYSRLMAKKLNAHFLKPYEQHWRNLESLKQLSVAKDLFDFEKTYYQFAGFENYDAYCKATNPIYVFEKIRVPLMILNSEDDPVCHIRNLEPYKEVIQHMPNMAVVTTKKGSHCCFYEGNKNPESWAHKLIAEFFLELEKA